MKKRFLFLIAAALLILSFGSPSWAQCPDDPNDRGNCDSLIVTCLDCEQTPGTGPWHVRFPILVTHDQTVWQDSLAGFITPLVWTRTNPAAYCSVSSYWNTTEPFWFFPWFSTRSMFRHIVNDADPTDTLMHNRMASMGGDFSGREWDTRIVDLSTDDAYGRMCFVPTGTQDQKWWEGDRVLLATLTYVIEDTMTICMDTAFWPPAGNFLFSRADAVTYVPRDDLPHCFRVGPPGPPPGSPVADADPDTQSISVGGTANFDGSNSHDTDGGTIVSYDWDFGDGNTGTGATVSHPYTTENTFLACLTVTDNDGKTGTDCVTVIVQGDPPVADANGPYSGAQDSPLTFDGSGSSDDFGIVAYEWDFGDGATSTEMMPTHAYSTHGTYLVTLTVYDIMSQADSDTAVATILGPPVADADPDSQEITVGDTANFDGSNSHDSDGGTIVSYEWDFGDGSTSSGVTTSHAYSSEGTFEVCLTVMDDDSLIASDSVTVAVLGDPPVADADGPYQASEDVPLTFDGSGSSDDFGIVAYEWHFGDGATSTQMMPTHVYSTHGTYLVTLTVYDIMSQADTDTAVATILGRPVADADPDSQEISPGDTAYFDASNSHDTDGGTIVSYEWDFGDGSTGSGVTTSHAYSSEGTFEVCLTVMDDDSLTDTNCVTVRVSYPPPAITVYPNDRPGWESAVGVYEEEFFTDATLNPGVSVVSDYPGYVNTTKGVWWDRLVCPDDGLTTTTWQFDTPIISYGGNWNPGVPGGPGAHIAVAINGSWVNIGEIPSTYTGQFWGFVSSKPFSAVRLSPGSNCSPPGGAWCETYEINSMVYSISEPCIEKSFTDTTLFETLLAQEAALTNVQVSGDFNSVLDFTDFEIVSITTGPFAGKGFSKGQFETTLEGALYQGEWKGALFLKPQERKIHLKGAVTGQISATVEGYLTESDSGSGIYNQYQATWRIGRLGMTTTSATINLNGTVSYQSSSEFPNAELYVLQSNIEGTISGHYSGPFSTVLTHLRVTEETNPYWGEGFSIMSYVSESGSGEGWTYDKLVSPGRVRLKGLFNNPLFGIVSGTLDESELPRTLFLNIERVDLGLPPMADLEVKTWGPTRVSPGQTISYVIEYRNDGLMAAEDIDIVMKLANEVEFVSATDGGTYTDASHEVIWYLGNILPKSTGQVSAEVRVLWGLPWGTSFENIVSIPKQEIEVEIDPTATIDYEILETSDEHLVAIANISNQFNSGSVDVNITSVSVSEDIEPIFEYVEMAHEVVIRTELTIHSSPQAIYKILKIAKEVIETLDKIFGTIDDVGLAKMSQEKREAYLYWLKENDRISQTMYDDLPSESKALFWDQATSRTLSQLFEIGPELTERMEKSVVEADRWFRSKLGKAILEHEGRQFEEDWYQDWNTRLDCAVAEMDAYKDFLSDPEISDAVDSHRNEVAVAQDPNIKYGPEGYVQAGQTLDYEVEFENEGEGIAFGVYITDVLDEDLDDLTLSLGGEGTYNPSTRTITWFVGEVGPGEGGKFNFSVNIRSDAPEGTEVINYATVYFPSVPEITRTNGVVCIIPINRPPIANAGPDQTVECTSPDGAQVTLDGTGSSDPDSDPLTFTWRENGNIIAGPTTDPISTVTLAPGTHAIELTVDDGQGETDTDEVVINVVGAICGDVTHDNGNPVANVTVKVIDSDNNQMGDPIVTGADGSFYFDLLPVGTYSVMIVTPLGYSVSPGETQTGIEVTDCPCTEVYFVLTPTITSNDCRTIGYWQHQFDVYLSGRGHAQEDSSDLEDYLDLVHVHFDVLGVYFGLENYDFEDAKNVLTVRDEQLMEDRAKQQLFALLLNFASGRIGNETVVSDDDRVAAEAVTYAAILINDGDPANDELAKTICDLINNGQMVEAGIIPESPERYKVAGHDGIPKEYVLNQNYPNPFNPTTSISFNLSGPSRWSLQIYNTVGQLVKRFDGYSSGEVSVRWDGTNHSGDKVSSGIYFYKLSAGDFTATKKMVLTK